MFSNAYVKTTKQKLSLHYVRTQGCYILPLQEIQSSNFKQSYESQRSPKTYMLQLTSFAKLKPLV